MRIYTDAYELMSEMGRDLWEMGIEVKPHTYQNKNIEGIEDFITKEIICSQYCLTNLPDPENLFIYTDAREWADEEFRERIYPYRVNPGEAWQLRKDLWEQFLVDDGNGLQFDYTYNERMQRQVNFGSVIMNQVEAIIKLLKRDPDTRKAVLAIYDPSKDANHYTGDKRIPCSMYYDFLIRDNASGEKVLNIVYHQRSSDFVDHFGNDVYLAWQLKEYIADRVGVNSGHLYHTIDSLHAYKKDWIKLKTSLSQL